MTNDVLVALGKLDWGLVTVEIDRFERIGRRWSGLEWNGPLNSNIALEMGEAAKLTALASQGDTYEFTTRHLSRGVWLEVGNIRGGILVSNIRFGNPKRP